MISVAFKTNHRRKSPTSLRFIDVAAPLAFVAKFAAPFLTFRSIPVDTVVFCAGFSAALITGDLALDTGDTHSHSLIPALSHTQFPLQGLDFFGRHSE